MNIKRAGTDKKQPLKPQSFASVVRAYYKQKMSEFKHVAIEKDVKGRKIKIGFTSYGNKHLYSDTFRRSKTFSKGDLLDLPNLLRKSTHEKSADLYKDRDDKISKFHYFKVRLHGNIVYLNVAEEKRGNKRKRYLYSVTDKIKVE